MDKPPLYRLIDWMLRRAALCEFCKAEPRQTYIGEGRYCSESCEQAHLESWVHG